MLCDLTSQARQPLAREARLSRLGATPEGAGPRARLRSLRAPSPLQNEHLGSNRRELRSLVQPRELSQRLRALQWPLLSLRASMSWPSPTTHRPPVRPSDPTRAPPALERNSDCP